MTHDNEEPSAASAGSLVGEPTREQAAFHRWQEFCKSCGFRLYDTPEAMSAFLEGIRFGMATSLTDAEREAIQEVIDYLQPAGQRHQNRVAATLRGFLERTK